jgi:hypothetical protein
MMPNRLVVWHLLPLIHHVLGFSHSIHSHPPKKKKLDIISTSQIIHLVVKGLFGIQYLWQMDERCFYGQREFN